MNTYKLGCLAITKGLGGHFRAYKGFCHLHTSSVRLSLLQQSSPKKNCPAPYKSVIKPSVQQSIKCVNVTRLFRYKRSIYTEDLQHFHKNLQPRRYLVQLSPTRSRKDDVYIHRCIAYKQWSINDSPLHQGEQLVQGKCTGDFGCKWLPPLLEGNRRFQTLSTSAVFLIFSDFADLQRVNVPLTQMWILYQLSSNTEHRIDLHRIWSNLALGTQYRYDFTFCLLLRSHSKLH